MTGKKARGSWDSYDGRTKAGRSKSIGHPHQTTEAAEKLIGGLFNSAKKSLKNTSNKPKTSSTSDIHKNSSYQTREFTDEEKQLNKEKDKKRLPFLIVLGVIGLSLVIWFWVWIVSLF